MSSAAVSRPPVELLRATRCVAPARGCPHRESVEIQQRTTTILRASVQVHRRSASFSKDTGAARSARTSARVRGPILAMRRGGRGVLTPWPRLPFAALRAGSSGEGERKEDLYARGIAETAGDGRTGAGFPPGPSGGGDSGSRGGGVGTPRGADRAGGGAGGAAAGRRGGEARVHRTACRGAARAAGSATQVSVRGWQGGGAGEHGAWRAVPAAGDSRDQPGIPHVGPGHAGEGDRAEGIARESRHVREAARRSDRGAHTVRAHAGGDAGGQA